MQTVKTSCSTKRFVICQLNSPCETLKTDRSLNFFSEKISFNIHELHVFMRELESSVDRDKYFPQLCRSMVQISSPYLILGWKESLRRHAEWGQCTCTFSPCCSDTTRERLSQNSRTVMESKIEIDLDKPFTSEYDLSGAMEDRKYIDLLKLVVWLVSCKVTKWTHYR